MERRKLERKKSERKREWERTRVRNMLLMLILHDFLSHLFSSLTFLFFLPSSSIALTFSSFFFPSFFPRYDSHTFFLCLSLSLSEKWSIHFFLEKNLEPKSLPMNGNTFEGKKTFHAFEYFLFSSRISLPLFLSHFYLSPIFLPLSNFSLLFFLLISPSNLHQTAKDHFKPTNQTHQTHWTLI